MCKLMHILMLSARVAFQIDRKISSIENVSTQKCDTWVHFVEVRLKLFGGSKYITTKRLQILSFYEWFFIFWNQVFLNISIWSDVFSLINLLRFFTLSLQSTSFFCTELNRSVNLVRLMYFHIQWPVEYSKKYLLVLDNQMKWILSFLYSV